jgi:trigger factor
VTDEDVEEALEHVRSHHEVLEPVDREVMEGDVVAISGTGEIVTEDAVNVIFDEERVELLMDPETTFAGTEFVKNMLGMEVGDEGEFTITFPEDVDDEDLAGKEATFNVTLLDVKSRYLPELDDELAKAEGDYETVEELRAALREQLEAQAQQRARNDLFDAMMDQMIAEADIVFPPAAIEEELDGMLESTREQATRAGWQWNDYLTLQGETEESLREAWREQAEERLERGLVLREFIRNEKLGLDEQEIDAAVEQRLEQYGEGAELQEQIRQFFRQGQGLEMLSTELVMEKVYDRVEQIAAGIAPDLESLATEAASSDEEE